MGKYQRPRGTHDLYPHAENWEDDSVRWNCVEALFRELCSLHNFAEVRTPIFEATDLFKRTIGEGTDIVTKEMYTFDDLGGRSMTLRPEGTAPTLRAYVDSPLSSAGGVTKMFYIASIFRYERQQKGRYRQHQQLGVEALGSDDPYLDAEIINLAMTFFRKVGIRSLELKINSVGGQESRSRFVEQLKSFVEPHLQEFSDEGRARFAKNPLRMLDTKSQVELDILKAAPHLIDFLSVDEATHFECLQRALNAIGLTYTIDHTLVRGFDYYTKTAFEIQSPDLGAQSALGGGGRYNQLVADLGGQQTPGIGFGIGMERVMIALQAIGADILPSTALSAYVVLQNEAGRDMAFRLLHNLREAGISADMDFSSRSLKNQMRAASKSGARYTLVIGEEEMASSTVQIKDMNTGNQDTSDISKAVSYIMRSIVPVESHGN